MKKYHLLLNLLGTLFWIGGLILSANLLYPYALIGLFGGPLLLLFGTFFWLNYYNKKNGKFPNPISSYQQSLKKQNGLLRRQMASFDFLFSHILEFWTFCIIFWIGIMFLGSIMLKSSNAYKSIITYTETDSELQKKIGKINYYGYFVSGSASSDGTGDLHLTIIGEKESVKAHAIVEDYNGKSIVTSFKYEY